MTQGERNYIMQVVCEATQNPSVPVQVAAFECLVRIMSLYYDKMGFYMERALFGVSVYKIRIFDCPITLLTVAVAYRIRHEASRGECCATSG